LPVIVEVVWKTREESLILKNKRDEKVRQILKKRSGIFGEC